MQMIEHITNNEMIVAIIIRVSYKQEGIEFFTPDDFSQQLAYMNRPAGYCISPHIHCKVNREVLLTQEVLFIKQGKVQIDFFDDDQHFLQSTVVYSGDVIMLASGGHSLTFIEQSEIIEVKQGPYLEEGDKVRFENKK
jgi:mannose-6-phosphate isomerase-like protein (cupin superfamily)